MDFTRLGQQMIFLLEADKIKSIFRQNFISDGSRRENDAEHSWHCAVLVMILAEYFTDIDILKTLKMILIHDMVEIYAGDTFAYDDKAHEGKEEREVLAAEKIFSLLPVDQKHEYISLWKEFERMESQESICASIADRIQPLTLNISTKGKMWKEHGVTVEKVLKRNEIVFSKAPKIIADYIHFIIDKASDNKYFAS